VENWSGAGSQLNSAIMFNRKLWSIFMSDAINDENPLAVEIRQNIANIGIFVMKQTVEIQTNPAPEKLKSLIDINCNLAAGLSGRA
jgi:flagellar protein FlaF